MFINHNNKYSLQFGIHLAAIILLSYAVFTSQKYGFYMFLRVYVFVSCLYLAWDSYKNELSFWFSRFLIIAFVYNPLIKFALSKSIWIKVNSITLAFFVISTLVLIKKYRGKINFLNPESDNKQELVQEIQDLKNEIEKYRTSELLNNIEIDLSKLDQFDKIGMYTEGLALVSKNDLLGYIDKRGDIVIKPKFEWASYFSEGLAAVKEKHTDLIGYIDKSGNYIIKPKFISATIFKEGLASVSLRRSWGWPEYCVWGCIDKNGNYIIKPKFTNSIEFSSGLAPARSYNFLKTMTDDAFMWGYINKNGKYIIKPQYHLVSNFNDGQAFVVQRQSYSELKIGLINTYGRFTLLEECQLKSEHHKKLNSVIEYCFSDGLTIVKIGKKYGFANISGKLVISPIYDYTLGFYEGLAAVRIDGKWGYINKKGEYFLNPTYDSASPFSEGIAFVKKDGKWVCIKKPNLSSNETDVTGNFKKISFYSILFE